MIRADRRRVFHFLTKVSDELMLVIYMERKPTKHFLLPGRKIQKNPASCEGRKRKLRKTRMSKTNE